MTFSALDDSGEIIGLNIDGQMIVWEKEWTRQMVAGGGAIFPQLLREAIIPAQSPAKRELLNRVNVDEVVAAFDAFQNEQREEMIADKDVTLEDVDDKE